MLSALHPLSSASRKKVCSSTGPGVVLDAGTGAEEPSGRRSFSIVETRPQGMPQPSMTRRTRLATVVLPFVPVTAKTSSSRDGCPAHSHARAAAASLPSATRSHATYGGSHAGAASSETTRTAPASTAARTKALPSREAPKTSPGRTSLESVCTLLRNRVFMPPILPQKPGLRAARLFSAAVRKSGLHPLFAFICYHCRR